MCLCEACGGGFKREGVVGSLGSGRSPMGKNEWGGRRQESGSGSRAGGVIGGERSPGTRGSERKGGGEMRV